MAKGIYQYKNFQFVFRKVGNTMMWETEQGKMFAMTEATKEAGEQALENYLIEMGHIKVGD